MEETEDVEFTVKQIRVFFKICKFKLFRRRDLKCKIKVLKEFLNENYFFMETKSNLEALFFSHFFGKTFSLLFFFF